jgi:hypothetical protein
MMERIPLPKIISTVFLAAVVAIAGTFLAYQLWAGCRMMPTMRMEGFAGPSRGAGVPDCTRTSKEAAALIATFRDKASTVEEGADDLRELSLIAGKLACFKRDLMSPGHLVEATRKQPFSTSHDMEPIAETCARVFAKTIPKRDLDLSFDKWKKRGSFLIRRLCTAYDVPPEQPQALLDALLKDVYQIAVGICQKSDATIAGMPTPRLLDGVEPAGLSFHMEYKGYY